MRFGRLALALTLSLLLLASICSPVQANEESDSVDLSATVPVVISDVSASSIGYYSATISWKTNGDATSQVFYDTEFHESIADYAYSTTEDTTLVSEHSIRLTGLTLSTTYHYRVRSAIDTEFIAISEDFTFTTRTPPVAPVAEFSASPTSGTAPLTVDFTDESTGNINTWSWTFGDGGTSTERSPSYTYSDAGTYDVSLEVTGPGVSDTEIKLDYIIVSAAPVEYDLTISSTAGGLVTEPGEGTFPDYDVGEEVSLVASPDTGYQFVNWIGDTSDIADTRSASTTITMNGDYAITANFTQIPYTLTIDIVGSGSVTKVPDQVTYTYGDVVQLTAVPDTGWSFDGWSGDLTRSTNPDTITMDSNKSVTANFAEIVAAAVTTDSATGIGRRTATLNGTLTNLGSASSVEVSFEWGETTSYGNETATQTMTSTDSFSVALSGLSPNTSYHFRAVAVGDGTGYGIDRTFTTMAEPAPVVPPPTPPAPPPGTTDVRGMVTTAGVFLEPVTATSEDELCTLTVPEGTVGLTEELEPLDEITVVIMDEPPPPPEDAHVVGLTYDLGPDGATFDPPITLTFSYDPDALPEGVAEEDLVLAYYDEEPGEWVELDGVVDTENNTITASVPHFTTFAIIGVVPVVAPPTPAPARFTVSSLGVSPSELAPGEEVNISVLVANTGGKSGSYTVVLKIDGVKEAEKRVTVAAGRSQSVSFSVAREEADTYAVTVDGLSGGFTVVPVVAPPAPAAFSVSRLSFQPAEVEAETAVTIALLVANTGGTEGSYTVVLKVNGVKEAEKTVTIAAGDSQDVSFSLTRDEPGTYSVSVDGLSGGFTVIVVTPPPGVNWPLIGGIIAGVIVVGLLIYFLVFRRRAY